MAGDAQGGILDGNMNRDEAACADRHVGPDGPRARAPFSDTTPEVGGETRAVQVCGEHSGPRAILLCKKYQEIIIFFCL